MREQLQRDQSVHPRGALPWVARRSPPVRRTFKGAAAASLAALALGALFAAPAQAQPDPSGIDFVTIGSAGNAGWAGRGRPDQWIGRGGVSYEYRIGRFEVTSQQWAEFFSAAFDRPANDRLPHLQVPQFWGATPATPNTPGGQRWVTLPGNEMIPVGNISWRMAAMYCNWLHNDKSTLRSAFLDGAYDVSTFGYINGGNVATDQAAHHPGARYWIPTLDEMIKASHYDPSKPNPDGTTGGYWLYSNGSNQPWVGAPPASMGGNGTANFGWRAADFPGANPYAVPLGAYPTTNPWGLFDIAGGSSEWTEEVITGTGGIRYWVNDGSFRSGAPGFSVVDAIYSVGGEYPSFPLPNFGLRIATIPSPPTLALLVLPLLSRRRRLS
jgi:hypothetical protein